MTADLRTGRQARYRLYGACVETDHRFAATVEACSGPPDLSFRYVDAPPERVPDDATACYASPVRIDEHQSLLYVHVLPECTVLRFTEVVEFYLRPDGIECLVLDHAYAYMVEVRLLAEVLPLWLELRGIAVLHASGAVVDDGVVAFLATNKGGKSTLAASLMVRGHDLLTDDVLALEWRGSNVVARPSYPQMRMWPDHAANFVGDVEALEAVHPGLDKRRVPIGRGFGSFARGAAPLRRIYLPRRGDTDRVVFTPLSAGEAVVELVSHSILLGVVEALGLAASRFMRFARLVESVPVQHLHYPDGVHVLDAVCEAIVDDTVHGPGGRDGSLSRETR